MKICGNSEVSCNNLIGDLMGYKKTIWYKTKGKAKILLMYAEERNLPVTYNM